MKPTNELRFVEREVEIHLADCLLPTVKTVQVLQQKWENTYWTVDESGCKYIESEWRDVPVCKEDAK